MATNTNSRAPMSMQFLTTPNLGGTNLGGGKQGFIPNPIQLVEKGSDAAMSRKVLVKSWNTAYATQNVNGKKSVSTPFRLVNNSGDYLGRVHYNCGGPNPAHTNVSGGKARFRQMFSNCDASGIPPSSTNVKFVADSSEYTKFKNLNAKNRQYNDISYGGDKNNASYFARNGVHRGQRGI